jgi:hypothetical protein
MEIIHRPVCRDVMCSLASANPRASPAKSLLTTFAEQLSSHERKMDIVIACMGHITTQLNKKLARNMYELICLLADGRFNLLVPFTLWLLKLLSTEEKEAALPTVFSFEQPSTLSFPDPSLALTSSLGFVFLPFLSQFEDSPTNVQQFTMSGTLCLYFAAILIAEPALISDLESGDDIMKDLLYFLFLHSASAKDKLSLPRANDLWTFHSELGESEFLQFQTQCVEILERVR